jgi:methionine sulfoxide reductase heme-binding subunit
VPDAIDVSSTIALIAIGALTANILLGLLISTGYNPLRRWPRRRIKLFKLHNWTGYAALAIATLHPLVLLASTTAGFTLLNLAVPLGAPSQPRVFTVGAIAWYLVAFAVLTSYYRHAIGFHRWKQLHFATYGAAIAFVIHGLLADPLLKNRPIDFLDAEKLYVEGCGTLIAIATIWRIKARRHHVTPR